MSKSNVPTFGKVKVRFPKNPDGTLGRVQFEHDFGKHAQTEISSIIIRMFVEGVAALCNQCRHAKQELSISFAKRESCPNWNKEVNTCNATNKPCYMSCARVVEALNEYRKKVNAEGDDNGEVQHESNLS